MKIQIIAVDRGRDAHMAALAEEYLKRLQPYFPTTVVDLKPADSKNQEGKTQLAAIANGATVVVMDERGELFTTVELSQKLEKWQNTGVGTLAILIGGTDGLAPAVKEHANKLWALSKLTLPHRLAKVFLLEQLYRAATILNNHPYHRT